MKLYKIIVFILIVFFKTETIFSENYLFNVNNIELEKKDKTSNKALAEKAIKKGFDQLIKRILLKEDVTRLSNLSFNEINQLVAFYQVANNVDETKKIESLIYNVTFDKDKIHKLFYKLGVAYSEISDKELYILPILIKENEIFIFNNNYFYENWNKIYENDLIEFILPLENIEIIKKLNMNKNNLINIDLIDLFQEYSKKNLALIFIEESKINKKKTYIKTIIGGKNISKSLDYKKEITNNIISNEKIIVDAKKELINLIKSKNLIDIRTPSFLNAKLDLNKQSNLVELNSRIRNIDLIENIYVQEFNKDYMNLRIKYLGKLEKMINQLKKNNISLKLINDQWIIKTL